MPSCLNHLYDKSGNLTFTDSLFQNQGIELKALSPKLVHVVRKLCSEQVCMTATSAVAINGLCNFVNHSLLVRLNSIVSTGLMFNRWWVWFSPTALSWQAPHTRAPVSLSSKVWYQWKSRDAL